MKLYLPWFYVTRAAGLCGFIYALFFDRTGDRGTIIVAACGLMGVDKIVRGDDKK